MAKLSKFWRDAGERFLATLIEAFCGGFLTAAVLSSTGILPMSSLQAGIMVGLSSAVISGMAFVKALAARRMGDPGSASLIE